MIDETRFKRYFLKGANGKGNVLKETLQVVTKIHRKYTVFKLKLYLSKSSTVYNPVQTNKQLG